MTPVPSALEAGLGHALVDCREAGSGSQVLRSKMLLPDWARAPSKVSQPPAPLGLASDNFYMGENEAVRKFFQSETAQLKRESPETWEPEFTTAQTAVGGERLRILAVAEDDRVADLRRLSRICGDRCLAT